MVPINPGSLTKICHGMRRPAFRIKRTRHFIAVTHNCMDIQYTETALCRHLKHGTLRGGLEHLYRHIVLACRLNPVHELVGKRNHGVFRGEHTVEAVSYTHLRAHETPEHLVCR